MRSAPSQHWIDDLEVFPSRTKARREPPRRRLIRFQISRWKQAFRLRPATRPLGSGGQKSFVRSIRFQRHDRLWQLIERGYPMLKGNSPHSTTPIVSFVAPIRPEDQKRMRPLVGFGNTGEHGLDEIGQQTFHMLV